MRDQCIANPIAIAIIIDSPSFINANLVPKTLAVKGVDSNVIPGPAKRNAMAGPNPAPFLHIPAKRGKTVQLHTSMISPLVAANT